jgi:hypothetical protein
MMEDAPLLTVKDHFQIEGNGLVLIPLLDLPPDDRRFVPFNDTIRVVRPDKTEQTFETKFAAEHFYRPKGKSAWHIVLMIPEGTKETIPVGTRVYVNAKAQEKLKGQRPNTPPLAIAGEPGSG